MAQVGFEPTTFGLLVRCSTNFSIIQLVISVLVIIIDRDIKLVNNKEDYLKQVMKPNFKGGVLMGADLMSCEMGKVKVKMNKPVYLGQVILDLSKT